MLFYSLESCLKPSSTSCREWATVSIHNIQVTVVNEWEILHVHLCLCPGLSFSNHFLYKNNYFSNSIIVVMGECVVMFCISCRGTWVVLILPSVSLAPFSQLLMWRIGGWVEGQVLPPPRSPLTSYCCPVGWHWHFEIYFDLILLWIQYFGLLWTFYFCCHCFFFNPKDINPHCCFSKIIFP